MLEAKTITKQASRGQNSLSSPPSIFFWQPVTSTDAHQNGDQWSRTGGSSVVRHALSVDRAHDCRQDRGGKPDRRHATSRGSTSFAEMVIHVADLPQHVTSLSLTLTTSDPPLLFVCVCVLVISVIRRLCHSHCSYSFSLSHSHPPLTHIHKKRICIDEHAYKHSHCYNLMACLSRERQRQRDDPLVTWDKLKFKTIQIPSPPPSLCLSLFWKHAAGLHGVP